MTYKYLILVLWPLISVATEKASTEKASTEKIAIEKSSTEKIAIEKIFTEKISIDKKIEYGAWNMGKDAFMNLQNDRNLVFLATPYGETSNPNGNIIEAYKDANGKKTIEVWPVTGRPDAHVEAIRLCIWALSPGDELCFHEGLYERFPTIDSVIGWNSGGTPDNPIHIRGYGNGENRPLFRNTVRGNASWRITQSNLMISYLNFENVTNRGLMFQGAPKNKNAAHGMVTSGGKVSGAGNIIENLTITDCLFGPVNATTIGPNSSGVEINNFEVSNCRFEGSYTTILYIGEQNGGTPIDGFIFRNNFIDASKVTTRPDLSATVGYSMELKRGVAGVVMENNLIISSYGPGVMFYGGMPGFNRNETSMSYIRNNVIVGGRNSDGILVCAGPVIVEFNILMANPVNLFFRDYTDYSSQDVQKGITVQNNFLALPVKNNMDGNNTFNYEGTVRTNNVEIGENADLRAVLDRLLKLRMKPDGFDDFMSAMNRHYTIGKAYSVDEIVKLFSRLKD